MLINLDVTSARNTTSSVVRHVSSSVQSRANETTSERTSGYLAVQYIYVQNAFMYKNKYVHGYPQVGTVRGTLG